MIVATTGKPVTVVFVLFVNVVLEPLPFAKVTLKLLLRIVPFAILLLTFTVILIVVELPADRLPMLQVLLPQRDRKSVV